MFSVYTSTSPLAAADLAEDRGDSPAFLRQIDKVKERTRIEHVAAHYGEFKLAGSERLLGRCISPAHEDRTPSMSLYTDKQRFRCFGIGCEAHGDVLDLVMLAEPGMELWVAMLSLSQRYGISLPERPRAWFRRQERQAPVRDAIETARVEVMMRRLWRWIFEPILAEIEDAEERTRIGDELWAAVLPRAVRLVEDRGSTA